MKAEADVFGTLGEPTRLRLAILLAIEGETCVCKLAQALDEPDCKISRHLGVMRAAGLVAARREATWMYYRLAEPRNRLEECLQECFRDCLAGHKAVRAALGRLERAVCGAGGHA